MKSLKYVDLQEQVLQGRPGNFSELEEFGVKSSILESESGDFSFWHKSIELPGVLIDHLKIKSPASVIIQTPDNMPSSVNMNFTLQGIGESSFDELHNKIENPPLKHNLLFLSNPAGTHILNPVKQTENIHLAFDQEYFIKIIGEDDFSFEEMHRNIEKKRTRLLSANHGVIDLKIKQVLADICNCIMKGSVKKLYLEAKVLELLALQLESLNKSVVTGGEPADKELFHHIHTYLTEHFLDEISLNSICRQFGINEFKLKRGFQHHFNTSVIRFLTGLRMQKARELLEFSDSSLLQVSELLNYSHPNHFSTAFKKYFGVAPSEVRRLKKVF